MKGEKKMKNKNLAILLFLSCLFMMIGTFAMAQDQMPSVSKSVYAQMEENGEGSASQDDQLKQAGKGLNLTDSQKQQLKSLREKRKAERTQQMAQVEASIKSVLTPDQQAQFDLNKSRMMSRIKNRKAGGDASPPEVQPGTETPGGGEQGKEGRGKTIMKGMFANITLTDSQKEKLRAMREAQKPKMQAMRAQRESDMKNILTPEQYQKFQQMKQNRGKRGGQQGCPQGGK
jgi:Spy/CpxP family protein refolding chaperone